MGASDPKNIKRKKTRLKAYADPPKDNLVEEQQNTKTGITKPLLQILKKKKKGY